MAASRAASPPAGRRGFMGEESSGPLPSRSCAMSEEFVLVSPKVVIPAEVVMPPVEQAPLPGVTVEAPPPEQGRVAEAYFSHQQDENRTVAGLMGMWAGT